MHQEMEERLWEYIDGTSSVEERSVIEALLESDMQWREKYKELMGVHELIHSAELEAPSMRFTKNVMEQIAKYQITPATKKYINKRLVWGIGIFFIAMVIGFLIYAFAQVDWTGNTKSNLPIDMEKLDWSKLFDNTYIQVFMMINVLLALVLFDRYLTNKKNKLREPNVNDL